MFGIIITLIFLTSAGIKGPDEGQLMTEWPETGPVLAFEIENIGNGYSSPAVSNNHIYITGEKEGKGLIFCYDLQGHLIWESQYGEEWITSYPGPRSAPLLSNGFLYICSGMGDIVCLNSSNGETIWSKNMITDMGGKNVTYGYSMPLILFKDMIICSPGGTENNVAALDKNNGDMIWSNPANKETAGYGSPIVIELAERNLLVTSSEFSILGIDADNGEFMWNYGLEFKGELPCNKPIYDGNLLYWVAGPVNGGVAVKLAPDGSKIAIQWHNTHFDTFFGGIVDDTDYLYGSSNRSRKYISVNKKNGKIENQLPFWIGSIIKAKDMFIAYNQKGQIGLIDVDNGKLELVSSFKIPRGSQEHFSHPVVENGMLFIRNGDKLLAFDISVG